MMMNALAQVVIFVTSIQEALGLHLGFDTYYPDSF
jgi:hypothetical protein